MTWPHLCLANAFARIRLMISSVFCSGSSFKRFAAAVAMSTSNDLVFGPRFFAPDTMIWILGLSLMFLFVSLRFPVLDTSNRAGYDLYQLRRHVAPMFVLDLGGSLPQLFDDDTHPDVGMMSS